MSLTKVQAIIAVMKANNGQAGLPTIYREIAQFLPTAIVGAHWQAGIRGVLYREIRNNRTFVKIDAATYGLKPVNPMPQCLITSISPALTDQ